VVSLEALMLFEARIGSESTGISAIGEVVPASNLVNVWVFTCLEKTGTSTGGRITSFGKVGSSRLRGSEVKVLTLRGGVGGLRISGRSLLISSEVDLILSLTWRSFSCLMMRVSSSSRSIELVDPWREWWNPPGLEGEDSVSLGVLEPLGAGSHTSMTISSPTPLKAFTASSWEDPSREVPFTSRIRWPAFSLPSLAAAPSSLILDINIPESVLSGVVGFLAPPLMDRPSFSPGVLQMDISCRPGGGGSCLTLRCSSYVGDTRAITASW